MATQQDNLRHTSTLLYLLPRVPIPLPSPLREKCPNTEFFWPVFSRIRTEYGEIVQMRENTDQKKLRIWTLFTKYSLILTCTLPSVLTKEPQSHTIHLQEPFDLQKRHTTIRWRHNLRSYIEKKVGDSAKMYGIYPSKLNSRIRCSSRRHSKEKFSLFLYYYLFSNTESQRHHLPLLVISRYSHLSKHFKLDIYITLGINPQLWNIPWNLRSLSIFIPNLPHSYAIQTPLPPSSIMLRFRQWIPPLPC